MKNLLFILLLGLGFSQTEWTTRVYDIDIDAAGGEEILLDMLSITGYDLSSAIIAVVDVNYDWIDNFVIDYGCWDYIPQTTFFQTSTSGLSAYKNAYGMKYINIRNFNTKFFATGER